YCSKPRKILIPYDTRRGDYLITSLHDSRSIVAAVPTIRALLPKSNNQCRTLFLLAPLYFRLEGAVPPVNASTLTRKRKLPPCWTPTTNCTLTLALAPMGAGSATTIVAFNPPLSCCTGGCSTLVP